MDRWCATNWPGTCSCCRIPVTDMFAAASCTLSERILLISKLSRLTSSISETLATLHLYEQPLSRASTFRTRRRETQEERGGTGVLYRSCKAKIRASIRCFETIRTRVTRPHCGGKGRKKGKFHLFCDSLSRGAASSQRIPRAGEYEWSEEGHRTAHFVISEGRGEGSSLEEEEEEEERRPCAESLKVWTRFRR